MIRLAMVLAGVALASAVHAQEVTGTLRGGLYLDDDHTTVIRSLATASATFGSFGISARESVDIVSSASVDVRSSPMLDAVSGASVTAPSMSDQRFETTLGGSWDDTRGHDASLSLVQATESDYTSLGGGLRGSWDFAERNTTLLGGMHGTHNRVTSVDDPTFSRSLNEIGYSLGVAQVLGVHDVVRLRYDGQFLDGYQASPYRSVRFGDWQTALRPGGKGLLFLGTVGSCAGLPENLPGTRVRHALVAEAVHSFLPALGLWVQARGADDSWGVRAIAVSSELRLVVGPWRARVGARGYLQGAASFYRVKYTAAPEMYEHYTADRELGDVRSLSGSLHIGRDLGDPAPQRLHARIDASIEILRYEYPDAVLLTGRTSVFTELGLRLEY